MELEELQRLRRPDGDNWSPPAVCPALERYGTPNPRERRVELALAALAVLAGLLYAVTQIAAWLA